MSTPSIYGPASGRLLEPGEPVPRAWELYSRLVDAMPSLSHEEEWVLSDRVAEGCEEALERLVSGTLRYALGIARRYRHLGVDLEDVVQDANVGLVIAARKFATERRVERLYFKPFAFWWIRYHVVRGVERQSGAVRLPPRRHRTIGRLSRARRRLAQRLGREPKALELAAATELDVADVELMLAFERADVSLEAPPGFDPEGGGSPRARIRGFPAEDDASDPASRLQRREVREEAERVLSRLAPRQALVLRLYYGLQDGTEHTLQEIGELLGMSRENVRLIRNRALEDARRITGVAPAPERALPGSSAA